jgi:hypothetical protein
MADTIVSEREERGLAIVAPAVSPSQLANQMRLFQELKARLLDYQTDVVEIQGRPFIKRSGWRKLALAFNISDEIVRAEKEDHPDGSFTWRITVRAWAPNGRSVMAVGACSSRERKFAHPEHDVYAIASTRAKNRAISDLIGSGEISAEELVPAEEPTVEAARPERAERPPASVEEVEYRLSSVAQVEDLIVAESVDQPAFTVTPKKYLGDEAWRTVNQAVGQMGGRWVSAGRDSKWVIPKPAGEAGRQPPQEEGQPPPQFT